MSLSRHTTLTIVGLEFRIPLLACQGAVGQFVISGIVGYLVVQVRRCSANFRLQYGCWCPSRIVSHFVDIVYQQTKMVPASLGAAVV
jgi:hypothetical protein